MLILWIHRLSPISSAEPEVFDCYFIFLSQEFKLDNLGKIIFNALTSACTGWGKIAATGILFGMLTIIEHLMPV